MLVVLALPTPRLEECFRWKLELTDERWNEWEAKCFSMIFSLRRILFLVFFSLALEFEVLSGPEWLSLMTVGDLRWEGIWIYRFRFHRASEASEKAHRVSLGSSQTISHFSIFRLVLCQSKNDENWKMNENCASDFVELISIFIPLNISQLECSSRNWGIFNFD